MEPLENWKLQGTSGHVVQAKIDAANKRIDELEEREAVLSHALDALTHAISEIRYDPYDPDYSEAIAGILHALSTFYQD